MPLPLLPFIIKGLFVAGKAMMAKGAAVTVAHAAVHSITTYGLAATIGGTVTGLTVVGVIAWGADQVKGLQRGFNALEEGDRSKAAKEFALVAIKIGTTAHSFPTAVHEYMVAKDIAETKAQAAADILNEMKSDIATEISRLKR